MAWVSGRAGGWRRHALTLAGTAMGGAALGGIGLGYVVAAVLTRPRRVGPYDGYTLTPYDAAAEYSDVAFAPYGEHAYELHGWWLARPETSRVIIGCHGYRGGKFELVGIGAALWRAGFNVLLFDFHGHRPGHSGPVTLGFAAVDDLRGAIAYVMRRVPAARIGVLGYSMGASVAIMGAARSPDVRAVVADTPFATHEAVVRHGVERILHVPGGPFVRIADVFLPLLGGYRHRDVQPVREVGAIGPRPLLLIHGSEDSISPVDHGYAVFAAAREPKELWVVEGAEHCGAYFMDRPGYCARVSGFFARALAGDALPADAAAPAVGTLAALRESTEPA